MAGTQVSGGAHPRYGRNHGTAERFATMAILMTARIAASWSFGREFVDDAVPALFAIATPRSSVAAAKFVVLAGWALLTVVSTVILTPIGGLIVGLDMDPPAVQTASRVAPAVRGLAR
jgi:ABC-type transport system involved in multi-copper enzyme maturation permease subunit